MEISVTLRFTKSYKKLNSVVKEKAKVKERIFRKTPLTNALKHTNYQEKEAWAFWVDYSYRIKFIFLTKNEVLFLDIGTHDFYK
ncbi:MAG: hypothetical protein HKUEN01_33680 [Candidatus Kuenenia stuttgartiensis]|nr:MAG: hypothetical protein HKUEN01_33680 [Candidatus Kuenenia stuttgartiensis]